MSDSDGVVSPRHGSDIENEESSRSVNSGNDGALFKRKKSKPGESNKQNFDFAAYQEHRFRRTGYHSLTLNDVKEALGDQPSSIVNLAARKMPNDTHQNVFRFNIHFLSLCDESTDQSRRYLVLLKSFYSMVLEDVLSKNLNDGDKDKWYTVKDIIDSILLNKQTTTVFVSVWKKIEHENENDAAAQYEEEILAAMSFCSNSLPPHESLFLGLFGVSDKKYKRKLYGQFGDNGSWRKRGLSKFLLQTVMKLHQSRWHYNGKLEVFTSLRMNYVKLVPFFRRLKFLPAAANYKDCFGVLSVSNESELKDATNKCIPFLAEGMVFMHLGK